MRRQPTTGTADDVGKEEHCGNQGSESGQLGGATQWGDDVAEQLAFEDQLNGRTGNRPHGHRCGPGECEHDKPSIPPTVRPDHAPEGQSAREQHIAGVAEHPVRPKRQIKKILDHLLPRSLGKGQLCLARRQARGAMIDANSLRSR